MDAARRELLVARIVAGILRCKICNEDGGNATVIIRKPSLEQIYLANEVYDNYYQECALAGCMSEEEVLDWMLEEELWTEAKQTMLDTATKNIEQLKIKMYESAFQATEKNLAREALVKTKKLQAELLAERSAYTYLSCLGAASTFRSRYLIAMSIYLSDGSPLFTSDSFWQSDDYILAQVVEYYYRSRIIEVEFREIARTDPWRSIWNARKSEGSVFGVPSTQLSDEQKGLTVWSSIYDSIYEHSECPSDSVIQDDDVLDGWMIIQRKKREKDSEVKEAESLISNEKVRNSSEIFLRTDNVEGAKKIDSLNDDHAKVVKRQRLSLTRKRGVVQEAEMPDARQEIQQQINRQFIEHAKGN